MRAAKSIPWDWIGIRKLTGLCTAVMFGVWTLVSSADAAPPTDPKTAEQLVDMAHEAAIDGDIARQFALLRVVVRMEPDDPVSHWQLGQIQVDGRWMSIEEAQRQAAADPAQVQYQVLRTRQGEGLENQLTLARWCRKNNLTDEARYHWANVLAVQPSNDEALRATGMRWHNGQLVSRDEIAKSKGRMREWKRATRKWTSTATKWERAVAGKDDGARDAAVAEVRSLTEAEAIPAMERLTLDGNREGKLIKAVRQIGLAFVDALVAMPSPAASESLVRHALFSPAGEVRGAAVAALKTRPVHEYVPLLLSGLGMPLESSFQVTTGPDGSVHYRHSLYREGPQTDVAIDVRQSALQHVLPGRKYLLRRATGEIQLDPRDTDHARAQQIAVNASVNEQTFGASAAAMEVQVRNANQAIESQNVRIMPVLAMTTDNDFDTPKEWWQWWTESNEYYSAEHPVEQHYYSDNRSYFHGRPYDTVVPVASCFVAGTPVWTKTGQRPVESLQIGDLVLAQDVDTGELAYKPVIGRTVRPPSPILKLSFDGEELLTTRGHPFWVAGVGWRMAKELGDAAMLYAVTGSVPLSEIQPAGELEAYNLVVADFNTYFVGETGVLVHDNTPRRPTQTTLPGF